MKPESYREQDGCWNCNKVFVRHEYDEWPQWFCTVGTPDRPLCCSVAMNEAGDLGDIFTPAMDARYNAWDKWADNTECRPYGKCDGWEKDTK